MKLKMPEKSDKNTSLRSFILGGIESEAKREDIEARLMTDDDFYQRLECEENELIQEYADGQLDSFERAMFEKNLLPSAKVREKVKFALALRRYVNEHTNTNSQLDRAEKATARKREIIKPESYGGGFWRPLPLVFGSLVILVGASFAFWSFFLRASETDRSLASLNRAYKSERPLQSRVTRLNYAPFSNLRGNANSNINTIERDRTEINLLDEATENPNPENLHALGRLYLLKKNFDGAIAQLEKAKNLAPTNAAILNDLGSAYLEKSKRIPDGEAGRAENAAEALRLYEEAVRLDPKLPDARFNKALSLEILNLPEQAETAWKEYLQLDADSGWAQEATRNLQRVESQKQR